MGPDLFADPTAGWNEDEIAAFWANATPEEVSAIFNKPTELTADQRKQLETIFAEEVAVALAEHSCSKDFNAKAEVISADVEEQYALEHEHELKQLISSLSAGK